MLHEQLAMERQNWQDENSKLKSQLKAMETDFSECARGKSPCFFCVNDDSCDCVDDKRCTFKWKAHK